MPALPDHLDTEPAASRNRTVIVNAARRLRTTMVDCRVTYCWWRVQRALNSEAEAQPAWAFDAEGEFLSAGKKPLDTKHAAFRAVTAIRTQVNDYWKGITLPFPEPGVRLIKLEEVENCDRLMADFKLELEDAVADLDRPIDELKRAASVHR